MAKTATAKKPRVAARAARTAVTALVSAAATPANVVSIFERVARDKAVDPAKMEALINLQERIMRINAEIAFNKAFARMQPLLPTIGRKGEIKNNQGKVQSRYSRYEDIQIATRPILVQFGFALTHKTTFPVPNRPDIANVRGILIHEDGHSRDSEFQSKPEDSGSKNDTQAIASANAYGRRHTTIDILNIICQGVDNDGQGAERQAPPAKRDEVKTGEVLPAETHTPPWKEQAQPPSATHSEIDEPITVGMRKRLFAILRSSQREELPFRVWLKDRYKIDSTTKIKRRHYDAICAALEARGPLPMREPGDDE